MTMTSSAFTDQQIESTPASLNANAIYSSLTSSNFASLNSGADFLEQLHASNRMDTNNNDLEDIVDSTDDLEDMDDFDTENNYKSSGKSGGAGSNGSGGGGGAGGQNGDGGPIFEDDKKKRRAIANSNERRRMQSINAGFQTLKTLIPHSSGEKLSKVSIEKNKCF
jgi:hypothetical protein